MRSAFRCARVCSGDLDRDGRQLDRGAKCDRSETFSDRFGLVALLAMFGAAERGEDPRVVREGDRTLIVEP